MKYFNLTKKSLLLPIILMITGSICFITPFFISYFFKKIKNNFFTTLDSIGLILIGFAIALFIYNLITSTLFEYEKSLLKKDRTIPYLILSIIRKGLKILFLLATLQIIVPFIGFSDFYYNIADKIIYSFLFISICWISLQIIKAIETVFYQYTITSTGEELWRSKATYTRIRIFRNILATIIIILTIAAILLLFENVKKIGISLLASAGLLTAIVGLAAQKTLSSLLAGFQLALTQPIKIGDDIIIEKEFGSVEQITLTYVTVKLWDLRRIIVPINYFLEKPFQNWTLARDNLIGTIFIYVDFALPLQPVRKKFEEILESSSRWNKKVSAFHVSDFKETAIELRMLVSANTSGDLYELRSDIREKLLNFIQENYPGCLPRQRIQTYHPFDKKNNSENE